MAVDASRSLVGWLVNPLGNFLRTWDYRPVTSWFDNFTINSAPLTVTKGKLVIESPANGPRVVHGGGPAVTDLNRLGKTLGLYADPRGPTAMLSGIVYTNCWWTSGVIAGVSRRTCSASCWHYANTSTITVIPAGTMSASRHVIT